MVSKGVKPNSSSYDAIIHGYGNVGDIELATKVLKSMLEDGHVSPSSRIYYSLIRSMVKEGEFASGASKKQASQQHELHTLEVIWRWRHVERS